KRTRGSHHPMTGAPDAPSALSALRRASKKNRGQSRISVARVSEAHPGFASPDDRDPGCGLRPYPGYASVLFRRRLAALLADQRFLAGIVDGVAHAVDVGDGVVVLELPGQLGIRAQLAGFEQ